MKILILSLLPLGLVKAQILQIKRKRHRFFRLKGKRMLTMQFDDGNHRILENGIPVTGWATYICFTYYKGFVGITGYYANREGIITVEEFMKIAAVT